MLSPVLLGISTCVMYQTKASLWAGYNRQSMDYTDCKKKLQEMNFDNTSKINKTKCRNYEKDVLEMAK